MKRPNSRGSALLISLVVLLLLTVATTAFLEKIWGFSRASEGIENSNVAYYNALGGIEETLMGNTVSKYTPWNVANITEGNTTMTGRMVVASTGGTSIPLTGSGNSIYSTDQNWNIISLGQPVQIVIPNSVDWSSVQFYFRVPQIGTAGTGVNASMTFTGLVLWSMASSGASLFASGETNIFLGSDINNGGHSIDNRDGITNSGSSITFWNFYTDPQYLWAGGSKCANYQCTLKLSLLRPIRINTPDRTINFLEYKIDGFNRSIPSQFMNLHAESYQYGFLRSRDVQIPQITTNTALDFAILQ